jgi:hypothetical protein
MGKSKPYQIATNTYGYEDKSFDRDRRVKMVASVFCNMCRTDIFGTPPVHHPGEYKGYKIAGIFGGWECACPCTELESESDQRKGPQVAYEEMRLWRIEATIPGVSGVTKNIYITAIAKDMEEAMMAVRQKYPKCTFYGIKADTHAETLVFAPSAIK